MKTPKTAAELRALVLAELARHHAVPPGFAVEIVPDGASWRARGTLDPRHAEQGELIARAVEIGDDLAHRFSLKA